MELEVKEKFLEDLIQERLKSAFGQEIDWILVDYFDSGKGKRLGKCECGRSLRKQYTVQHVQTGEKKNLGIVHLKEQMNITDAEVNKIKNGVNSTFKEVKEIEQPLENNDTQHEIDDFVRFADETELLILNRWLLQLQLGFSLSGRQQEELTLILKELKQRKNDVERKKLDDDRKLNEKAREKINSKKRAKIYGPSIQTDLPPKIEIFIMDILSQVERVDISRLWDDIKFDFKDIIDDRARIVYYTYLEALVEANANIIFGYEGTLKKYVLYQAD